MSGGQIRLQKPSRPDQVETRTTRLPARLGSPPPQQWRGRDVVARRARAHTVSMGYLAMFGERSGRGESLAARM
jgi:hypothetical protein